MATGRRSMRERKRVARYSAPGEPKRQRARLTWPKNKLYDVI